MNNVTIGIVLGLLCGFVLGWQLGRSWLRGDVQENLDAAIRELRDLYGQKIKLADGTLVQTLNPEVEKLLQKVNSHENRL